MFPGSSIVSPSRSGFMLALTHDLTKVSLQNSEDSYSKDLENAESPE